MANNLHAIGAIAKKEFTDTLMSPVFIAFALTFTIVIIAQAYVQGMVTNYNSFVYGVPLTTKGLCGMAKVIGRVAPAMGIVLGFDALRKEINLNTLNVLLTHPVFRDTIIFGKILASCMCILLTFFISINIASGILFFVSGIPVTVQDLIRIEIFIFLVFLYSLSFLTISFLFSILASKSSISLVYSVITWLFVSLIVSQLVYIVALQVTGEPQGSIDIAVTFLKLTPNNHYAQATTGFQDIINYYDSPLTINGIFDTAHSLSAWLREFWSSLIYLIVTPVLFLIASFIAFLRKDITL